MANETCRIALTQGQYAVVDSDWVDRLSQWKWHAKWCSRMKAYYAARNETTTKGKQRTIRMHRVIAQAPSGLVVDHRDHNTLNNTEANLRVATKLQNNHNQRLYRTSTSGHKGVTWRPRLNKWHARIQVDKTRLHLGYFERLEDASAAWREAAQKHFGEYAYAAGSVTDHGTYPVTGGGGGNVTV